MIDSPPSGGLAVYIFLEMIALGFALEAVAAFMRGDSWWKWLGALALGIIFLILGVESEKILRKCSQLVESGILGRRTVYALRALLILSSITVAAIAYYEMRRFFPAHDAIENGPPAPAPKGTKDQANTPSAPVAPPTHYLDWHDKQNWRRSLHTGMTRTAGRKVFGEPEKMRVSGDLEVWSYGEGEITFDMEFHSDGSLFSWSEP